MPGQGTGSTGTGLTAQPVGVFDSGVGGLSVVKAIRKLLPHENLLYIADSKNAPYGNKSPEFIRQRCEVLSRFLIQQGAKAIVVACNTATAAAVGSLRRQFAIPIIGMEPGVKPAISTTVSNTVGVLATESTLASEQFIRLLHRYAANVTVLSQPCPALVTQVERGDLASDTTRLWVAHYTQPLLTQGADTLVLGCTHYPWLSPVIKSIVGPSVSLIDTGPAVARQLQQKLAESHLLSDRQMPGEEIFWSSGDNHQAGAVMSDLWGCPVAPRPLPV